MQLEWTLDKSRPVCPQIAEQVCVRIVTGEFRPGEKLLSVREVALAAGVNPNTVQKAFETLERQGILYSLRGSGWYVSDDPSAAGATLTSLIESTTADFFNQMTRFGLTDHEIRQYVSLFRRENAPTERNETE